MGSTINIVKSGADTNRSLTLVEHIERKGGEPPFYIHYNEDELIHVKEGTLKFFLGDEQIRAKKRDNIFLPTANLVNIGKKYNMSFLINNQWL